MVVFTQRGAAYVPVHDRGLADKPSALSPRLGGSTEGPFHDSHVGETFDRIPVLEYLPAILQGQRNIMVGVRNNEVVYVPLSEAIRSDKPFDKKLIKVLDELSI